MAVVRADLGYRSAVTEHELKAVLWFPGAFAFDRYVNTSVAAGIPLDHRRISEPNVIENVMWAIDLDVPIVIASGQDIVHHVTVVGVDSRCCGFHRRSVEPEEGADCCVEVFLRGVVVVAVDDESASDVAQYSC